MAKATGNIAGPLASRPPLTMFQLEMAVAYKHLNSSRPESFGEVPMRIPVSEVASYYLFADLRHLVDRMTFLEIMRALDDELIEVKTPKAINPAPDPKSLMR